MYDISNRVLEVQKRNRYHSKVIPNDRRITEKNCRKEDTFAILYFIMEAF